MTDHQRAWARHAAANAALRYAHLVHGHACDDLEGMTRGVHTVDERARCERRIARADVAIADAERELEDAARAYARVTPRTRRQFADQLGIAPDTLSSYVTRGQAPQPDSAPGDVGHPWWYQASIDAWIVARPGTGARTDRKESPA